MKLKNKIILLLLLFVAGAVPLACNAKDDPEIARVGDSTLRLSQLEAMVPAFARDLVQHEQLLEMVRFWVDEQVLQQEALERGIHKDPDVAELLARSRRKILADRLLSRELADFPKASESELQEYLVSVSATDPQRYSRHDTLVVFSALGAPTAKAAWKLLKEVRSRSFSRVAAKLPAGYRLLFSDSTVTIPGVLPRCQTRALAKIGIGETTLPVVCGKDYLLLYLNARTLPGSPRRLEDVRTQVQNAWRARKMKNRKENFLARSKLKIPIVTFLENIPSQGLTRSGSAP